MINFYFYLFYILLFQFSFIFTVTCSDKFNRLLIFNNIIINFTMIRRGAAISQQNQKYEDGARPVISFTLLHSRLTP